ncbi:hypothetical protein ACIBG8_14455 [Nonomuraea sp. NPDC050556]|uniref:hypothetical protein n=1 Tax=Nonomuraea sp. NPDC050556 TaxID=3364369 RepID=UPI0037ACD1C9
MTDVISKLQRKGYGIIAPANSLRGLPTDASPYLTSVPRPIDGPIVLVDHGYGGAVIAGRDHIWPRIGFPSGRDPSLRRPRQGRPLGPPKQRLLLTLLL